MVPFDTQYTDNGKQKIKAVYGKTEKEVRKKLKELQIELIKYDYSELPKLTLKEWLLDWMNDIKKNEKKTNVLRIRNYTNWERIKLKSENSKLKEENGNNSKMLDSFISPIAYKPTDEEINSKIPKTTNNIRDINFPNNGNKIICVQKNTKKLYHKRNLFIT